MEWISTQERTPKEGQWVLVLSKKAHYVKLYESGIFYDGEHSCYSPKGEIIDVRYWMPLPEPPKD